MIVTEKCNTCSHDDQIKEIIKHLHEQTYHTFDQNKDINNSYNEQCNIEIEEDLIHDQSQTVRHISVKEMLQYVYILTTFIGCLYPFINYLTNNIDFQLSLVDDSLLAIYILSIIIGSEKYDYHEDYYVWSLCLWFVKFIFFITYLLDCHDICKEILLVINWFCQLSYITKKDEIEI